MIIFISMLSFYLDGIFSINFSPLFTIVSLVLIYPFFKGNDYRYYKYIAIIGLLYDIAYFNTVFFNFFIFIIIGFIIKKLFYYLSVNWYISFIIAFVTIVLYRSITFLYYSIFYKLDFNSLLVSIYDSWAINMIYCLIIYLIAYFVSKKYRIVRK